METETTSEFPNGGKAIVEQILAWEEQINPEEQDRESHSQDPSRKINHLSNVIWARKIITEFTLSISSTRKVSQSLWWTLKSPKTNTLADGCIERTLYMLDEIESKTMHQDKEGDH